MPLAMKSSLPLPPLGPVEWRAPSSPPPDPRSPQSRRRALGNRPEHADRNLKAPGWLAFGTGPNTPCTLSSANYVAWRFRCRYGNSWFSFIAGILPFYHWVFFISSQSSTMSWEGVPLLHTVRELHTLITRMPRSRATMVI